MNTAIIKKSDTTLAGKYKGAPNQAGFGGPWGDPKRYEHVEIPAALEADAVTGVTDLGGGSYGFTEDAGLKAEKSKRDVGSAKREQALTDLRSLDLTTVNTIPEIKAILEKVLDILK